MKKVKLNRRWKEILFAATGFGPNLLMTLMMAYFTDAVSPSSHVAMGFWSYGELGPMLVWGIIFPILWTIGRVFDGVIDVPLAAFTDNLKNKTGKRWISIIIAVVPMVLSFVLCWIPVFGVSDNLQLWQQIGNTIWIFVWSIAFFASYTLALITFYGALSDVCENQTQRARVSAYKSVFDTISYALVYAAIPAIFAAINVPIWKVALFGTPLMLTILIPLFMQSGDDNKVEIKEDASVPIGKSIALTFKSKPFLRWTIVNCVSFFGLQLFLASQNMLIHNVMGFEQGWMNAILNTAAFAPVPLMLLLFNKLRKSKGIRVAYQSALLSFGLCILSFSLGGSYIWGYGQEAFVPKIVVGIIGGIIGSWGIGAFFMVPYLIPTAIASVEEEITGKNHSAMYFAVQALATSATGAIATGVVYKYIDRWNVTKEVEGVSRVLYCGDSIIPFIVAVACVIGFFLCFKMPKEYDAKVVYNDIINSSKKTIASLEKKEDRILTLQNNKIAQIKSSELSDKEKDLLIVNLKSKDELKLAKIKLRISQEKEIFKVKFDENNSIGNEEKLVLEKNSVFGAVALFFLSGGIYGIVSNILDINYLKKINKKMSISEIVMSILGLLIPFISVYTNLTTFNKIKSFLEDKKVKVANLGWLIILTSILLPMFTNFIFIGIKTFYFNKASDVVKE